MRVTIGLPVSSQGPYFQLALKSVFAQTHQDWELLIVCDGADPATVTFLGRLDDPRVQLLPSDNNCIGLAARLNQIALACKTDLLARMDADDVMHPERIETQAAAFTRDPSIDIVGTRSYMIDDANEVLGLFGEPPLPHDGAGFLRSAAFCHPTVMGKAQWFRDNPYRSDFFRGQDKELWARTGRTSHFLKLDEPLLFYRVSNDATTFRRYAVKSRFDRRILRMHGPQLTSKLSLAELVMLSYAKQTVHGLAILTRRTNVLYKRKHEGLPLQEVKAASGTLRLVGRTQLPLTSSASKGPVAETSDEQGV